MGDVMTTEEIFQVAEIRGLVYLRHDLELDLLGQRMQEEANDFDKEYHGERIKILEAKIDYVNQQLQQWRDNGQER